MKDLSYFVSEFKRIRDEELNNPKDLLGQFLKEWNAKNKPTKAD
jgi:hypothetical protein